jgi:phage gpG-like protein
MIQIDIQDFITPALQHMSHNLSTLPMADIAQLMVDSVHQNFLDEGRPNAWAPRVEPTGSWPLLRKTDTLYNSIYPTISGTEITVDAGEYYGSYLDQGTSKMVARPFLLLQGEDERRIEELIDRHMGQI